MSEPNSYKRQLAVASSNLQALADDPEGYSSDLSPSERKQAAQVLADFAKRIDQAPETTLADFQALLGELLDYMKHVAAWDQYFGIETQLSNPPDTGGRLFMPNSRSEAPPDPPEQQPQTIRNKLVAASEGLKSLEEGNEDVNSESQSSSP